MKKGFLITSLVLFVFALAFIGCGKEEKESKSMEQIHLEEGLPIKVKELKREVFEKELSFFANLSGIKEATQGSRVGGKIQKVNGKVGDFVKTNQVIIEFADDNPGIMYEQSKRAYENSKKNYERMKALLEKGETSQAAFDGIETQYLVDKRNYETQKQLIFIESPFDGQITNIMVNPGDNVKGDVGLFTVAVLNKVKAKIWLTEDELVLIRKGMKVETKVFNKTYIGTITEVSLSADPYKRAFYAEVEFNNPNRELKSGVTVDVNVLVYSNSNAIVIQRNLLKRDQTGNFVFVEKGGKVEKRYVTKGRENNINVEVLSGLEDGEKIITTVSGQLEEGKKVKIIN